MPTSADRPPLLLDTSAALALVDVDHTKHAAVTAKARGHRLGLAGHACFETFSVLTRMPPPRRLTPAEAHRLIVTNFPDTRHLSPAQSMLLLAELPERGIAGGAVYDALVAAAARAHDLTLVTCDRRATSTYQALGVTFRLVG